MGIIPVNLFPPKRSVLSFGRRSPKSSLRLPEKLLLTRDKDTSEEMLYNAEGKTPEKLFSEI